MKKMYIVERRVYTAPQISMRASDSGPFGTRAEAERCATALAVHPNTESVRVVEKNQ